jgi:uncharacterized membrane protein
LKHSAANAVIESCFGCGVGRAVFLALALPANIHAALQRVPMGAHALGPVYLLARVPLQVFIAWWAYRFGVRQSQERHEQVPLPTP